VARSSVGHLASGQSLVFSQAISSSVQKTGAWEVLDHSGYSLLSVHTGTVMISSYTVVAAVEELEVHTIACATEE